jgi:hypothetical protein
MTFGYEDEFGFTVKASFVGTATYSSTGLLIDFQIGSDTYTDEFGATIIDEKLYTLFEDSNQMVIRDLSGTGDVTTYPIPSDSTYGSIGIIPPSSSPAFKGLVTFIDSANPTTTTISDFEGKPVLFTEPGRKTIELTTQQNIDEFLDGKVEAMQVEGEEFEIESIFAEGTTYQVTLQTPEIT